MYGRFDTSFDMGRNYLVIGNTIAVISQVHYSSYNPVITITACTALYQLSIHENYSLTSCIAIQSLVVLIKAGSCVIAKQIGRKAVQLQLQLKDKKAVQNCFILRVSTVDMEKFTGLNFHSFNPTKFLRKYFCVSLVRNVYYLIEVLIFTEKLSQCS